MGRSRCGNRLFSTMMQRVRHCQLCKQRLLPLWPAAPNTCSKVSACQEGVNHSRLMSRKQRHHGPQAQPWPNAGLRAAAPAAQRGRAAPPHSLKRYSHQA